MIDFTNLMKKNKTYGGSNRKKLSVIYDNELYMLKFPSIPDQKTDAPHMNSCISEYIGWRIYDSIGIPVQNVMLGTYISDSGKIKTVVACKDFAVNGLIIQDFVSLKNQIISTNNGYVTELSDIVQTIERQTSIDRQILSERFWDMFIIDALIGNWGRYNDNWGVLYDTVTDKVALAPVYACGNSLFIKTDEYNIENVLLNLTQMNDLIYNQPHAAMTQNKEPINYFRFISACKNKDCNNALKRIVPKIDMSKIDSIIDTTPVITNKRKLFLKAVLKARKEQILDFSYNKLY